MREAADMPELKEDASAARMDALGHLAPARDLLLGINTGSVLISLALMRNLGGFRNQQSSGGPLTVILDGERVRHQTCDRAVTGQRCHHEAIWKGDRTELERLEEFGRRAHFLISVREGKRREFRENTEVCIPLHCGKPGAITKSQAKRFYPKRAPEDQYFPFPPLALA